jgi:hypothetical protein
MSLIYGDSFQDDEDVCNLLAALQLHSRPTATSTTVPQVDTRGASTSERARHPLQNDLNVTRSAPTSSPTAHVQPLVPVAGPTGKCLPI